LTVVHTCTCSSSEKLKYKLKSRTPFRNALGLDFYSSVQFKMAPMRSEKPTCAPLRPSEVSPALPLKYSNVRLIDDDPFSSFQGRLASTSSFHAPLLQVIDGVMSLALCPQVVSQAPQHFRSSEKKATCEGCFARQSICSVFSFLSGMSRAVLPRKFSKVDVDHGRIPAWTYHSLSFHLCSKLIESVTY